MGAAGDSVSLGEYVPMNCASPNEWMHEHEQEGQIYLLCPSPLSAATAANESMLLYVNESKPNAGAQQLNDAPIVTGPPSVLRTGHTSLLVRLPKRVTGYSPNVSHALVSLIDAVSREPLLTRSKRVDASAGPNGTDVFLGNLPATASGVYGVGMVVVERLLPLSGMPKSLKSSADAATVLDGGGMTG